jgi:hypothetical protein
MTYKFVGALKGITDKQPHVMTALQLGILIGLVIEIARKVLRSRRSYQEFSKRSRKGRATDFVLDAFLLPSPYASSFGGFVEFLTTIWWAVGGTSSSLFETWQRNRNSRRPVAGQGDVPEDMSTTSLVGGGLIAGDSLAALSVGVWGLVMTLWKGRGG